MRKLILGAMALAVLLPLTGAQAEHCTDIYLFTRYTTDVENPTSGDPVRTSGFAYASAGCTHEAAHADTNLINPYANSFDVRSVKQNASGQYVLPTSGTATLSTGEVIDLTFTGGGGDPADSPGYFINDADPTDTSAASSPDFTITVKLCWGSDCQTSVHRTITAA